MAAGTELALRVAVVAEGLTVAAAGGGALGATSGTRAARLAVRVGSFGKAMSDPGPAGVAGVLVGAGIGSKDARLARTWRTAKGAAAANSTTSATTINHRRRRASPGISIGSS